MTSSARFGEPDALIVSLLCINATEFVAREELRRLPLHDNCYASTGLLGAVR
jgi:hypothetical protein